MQTVNTTASSRPSGVGTSPHSVPSDEDTPARRGRGKASKDVKTLAKRIRRASLAVRIPFRDRLRYRLYYIGLAHRAELSCTPTKTPFMLPASSSAATSSTATRSTGV